MHDDLLTVLDDDRINEEKYRYPYPEHEVIIIFLLFLSSVSSIFSAIFSSSSFTSSSFLIVLVTAKNPKNRYSDSRAMHDDLLTVLDDDRINEEKYRPHSLEY